MPGVTKKTPDFTKNNFITGATKNEKLFLLLSQTNRIYFKTYITTIYFIVFIDKNFMAICKKKTEYSQPKCYKITFPIVFCK